MKSPFSTVDEILSVTNLLYLLEHDNVTIPQKEHAYYAQIQGQLQSWPKGFGTLLLPPPLSGRKLGSDCQFTVVNTAMLRFPPPLPPEQRFFIHFWPVTPNTVQGEGQLLENARIICKPEIRFRKNLAKLTGSAVRISSKKPKGKKKCPKRCVMVCLSC